MIRKVLLSWRSRWVILRYFFLAAIGITVCIWSWPSNSETRYAAHGKAFHKIFVGGSWENISQTYLDMMEPIDEEKESAEAQERIKLLMDYHMRAQNATVRTKRLPDIIGIGVEKCGTGSVNFMLKWHAMLKSNKTEVHFFSQDKEYRKGAEHYREQLPSVTPLELSMEKTPGYFNFGSMETPFRMKKVVPKAKIWLVLCDPVARTFSDFAHEIVTGKIPDGTSYEQFAKLYVNKARRLLGNASTDLEANMSEWKSRDKISHVLTAGMYYYPLERWLKHYSLDEIHIIDGEDVIQNPGRVMEELQDFLGIPKFIIAEDFVRNEETGFYCLKPTVVWNSKLFRLPLVCLTDLGKSNPKGRTRSKTSNVRPKPETMLMLEKFFEPHNQKLFRLINRTLWKNV